MPTKKEILEMEFRTLRNAVVNVGKQRHQLARESLYIPYFVTILPLAFLALFISTPPVEAPTTCICPEASVQFQYFKCELEKTGATL